MVDEDQKPGFVLSSGELAASGFKEWLFCPGMLFQAAGKWWGNRGPRDRRHEGLDLLLYRDREGGIRHIDETFKIPVMSDGVVVGIISDFLGKSIIVEHPSLNGNYKNLLTIYGHTSPQDSIHPGLALRKGDIIASVAGPVRSSFLMTPHLHISVARAQGFVSYDQLDWDVIGAAEMLTLLDPLKFIDCSYRIVGDDHAACRALSIRKSI